MTIEPEEKTLDISTDSPEGSAETNRPSDEVPLSNEPFKLPLAKQPTPKGPIVAGIVSVLLFGALGYVVYMLINPTPRDVASTIPDVSSPASPLPQVTLVPQKLDISKDYGNKYANNILPVGDGKYQITAAKKGSVYACSQYAKGLSASSSGVATRGPWFTAGNTQYDLNKKPHVSGNVKWTGSFSNIVSGTTRQITTNDLPTGQTTGVFPVAATDATYMYDQNPNTIKAQALTLNLSTYPQFGEPQCIGSQVGVMLTGVSLFSALDMNGRDAGAWEIQDSCGGHPDKDGNYHYHTLSSCMTDTSIQTIIGFALDGFPITGPKVTSNSILTTNDLDDCHGISSEIILDNKKVTTYHYVMTQDFPYSVSCFRAKPAAAVVSSQSTQATDNTQQAAPTSKSQ